jgi:hypothetical protein
MRLKKDTSSKSGEEQLQALHLRKHPMNTTSPQGVDGRIVVA